VRELKKGANYKNLMQNTNIGSSSDDSKTKMSNSYMQHLTGKSLQKNETMNIKKQLQQQNIDMTNQEKRMLNDERQRAFEDMIQSGDDPYQMIIMPKYSKDKRLKVYREINPPKDSIYIGLGWDKDQKSGTKHYRQYYNDELENIKEIFPNQSPFNTYDLTRGQSRGLKSSGIMSMFFKDKVKKDESD